MTRPRRRLSLVAAVLGLSPRSVARLAERGELILYVDPNGRRFIDSQSVKDYTVADVAAGLGHSRASHVTLRYIHARNDRVRAAVEAVSAGGGKKQ